MAEKLFKDVLKRRESRRDILLTHFTCAMTSWVGLGVALLM